MRLWHKGLIPYLPRLQLVSQWRECCAICKTWAANGTPNHVLVNKVLKYPKQDFFVYTTIVLYEMKRRGYKVSQVSLDNFKTNFSKIRDTVSLNESSIFKGWHNDRYMAQCLYNLQEKYDCGGIPESEWEPIKIKYASQIFQES